jgi:WD40 repeat protein
MPGGHLRPVLAIAFSPDGSTLASAGRDYTIKLWSVEEHRLLATLFGHRGYVTGLAFSADGTTLASSSEDETVRLWDVKERRPLGEPLETGAKVEGVAFSPAAHGAGSSVLAAADEDGELDLWDASLWRVGTKKETKRLRRRLCHVAGGDLSPKVRAQLSESLRKACGWS